MTSTPQSILQRTYEAAQSSTSPLEPTQQARVEVIIGYAESQKAVLAALITSLTKKIESPEQDVRQHKVELPAGYSGRVYDTNYVTPFIRQKFPRLSMKSGSGWLTRSIEQLHAFTLDFPGRIANDVVKRAFLEILDDIQVKGVSGEDYLVAIFIGLLQNQQTTSFKLDEVIQTDLTVAGVIDILSQHFFFNYRTSGASRLPVIAIYSIYELLLRTLKQGRYREKRLLPLKRHTTSDLKSRSIGDVEVVNSNESFFEAVEIKYGIPISLVLVQDAFDKIQNQQVERYYLLTTAEPNTVETAEINTFITQVRQHHGCEFIVNGVMPSLKYYLRLLGNPSKLLQRYEENLLMDYEASTDIKQVHVEKWIELRQQYD